MVSVKCHVESRSGISVGISFRYFNYGLVQKRRLNMSNDAYEQERKEEWLNYYDPARRNADSGCNCKAFPLMDEKTGITGMLDENNQLLPEDTNHWYQKLIFQKRCSGCGAIYWPYYLYRASGVTGLFLGIYVYTLIYPFL